MKRVHELEVWKAAVDLVEEIYRMTRRFPDDEKFGLTAQLRRAFISIASNIAEGYGRSHRPDFLRFLSMARGSLSELQTQLVIAGRLKYLTRAQLSPLWKRSESVGKMLTRMITTLKSKPA